MTAREHDPAVTMWESIGSDGLTEVERAWFLVRFQARFQAPLMPVRWEGDDS